MTKPLSPAVLEHENSSYFGSGGRSQENRSLGLRPAFQDAETGMVYASCFRDGRPAPFHLLDGLPDEVILARNPSGRVEAVKQSVVSGFVLDCRFVTRDEAAAWVQSQPLH